MTFPKHMNRKLLARERCQAIDTWLKDIKDSGGSLIEAIGQLEKADRAALLGHLGYGHVPRGGVVTKLYDHYTSTMQVVEVLPLEAGEGQPTPRPADAGQPGAKPGMGQMVTRAQVYLMMSLAGRGWENSPSMVDVLLGRCSASSDELAALVDAGLVARQQGRFQLTEQGQRYFKSVRASYNI